MLHKKPLIDAKVTEVLLFAVAVACETRLKCYIAKQSQSDRVGGRGFHIYKNKIIKNILRMIGEQSLGDYFIVAYSLQRSINKNLFNTHLYRVCNLDKQFELLLILDLRN